MVEGFESRSLDAGGEGAPPGFAPDGFDLHVAAGDEVEHAAGAVVAHRFRGRDLVLDEGVRQEMAEVVGNADDFAHERAGEGVERGIGEDLVRGDAAAEDGEAIEGDVPDELFPANGGDAVSEGAVDAAGVEDFAGSRGRRPGTGNPGSKRDLALCGMFDDAWCGAIDAGEAHAAEDPLCAPAVSEVFFVPEAILERENAGVFAEQWRDDGIKRAVVGGFQGDNDEVRRAHFLCAAKSLRLRQREVAEVAFHR